MPSDISPVQAAQALFTKLFPKLSDQNWENITDSFPGLDVDSILVQEITFPADAVKAAEGTDSTASDSQKGSEDNSTEESAGTESGDSPDSETSSDDSDPNATADGDSTSSSSSTASGDSKTSVQRGTVCKEYIVYLKHGERLVACQFIPLTITEEQLEKKIQQMIPALKKVVKS